VPTKLTCQAFLLANAEFKLPFVISSRYCNFSRLSTYTQERWSFFSGLQRSDKAPSIDIKDNNMANLARLSFIASYSLPLKKHNFAPLLVPRHCTHKGDRHLNHFCFFLSFGSVGCFHTHSFAFWIHLL
jgi:hypothetical protein